MTVLLDPTASPDITNPLLAVPSPRADAPSTPATAGPAPTTPAPRPAVPPELAGLARLARTDHDADLALVVMLFDARWNVADIDAVTGVSRGQIEALADVRRPRTASSDVAERLVARRAAAALPQPT